MKIILSVCLLGLMASGICAAGSISLQVQNKCDDPISYKIEGKGSMLQSNLGSRTTSTVSVDEGDKIIYNGNALHVVSAASKDSTVVLCSK